MHAQVKNVFYHENEILVSKEEWTYAEKDLMHFATLF